MQLRSKFIRFILIPLSVLFIIAWIIIRIQVNNLNKKTATEKINNTSDLFSLFIYDKLKTDVRVLKTFENVISESLKTSSLNFSDNSEFLKNLLIQNHDYIKVWYILQENNTGQHKIYFSEKKQQKIVSKNHFLTNKDLFFKKILTKIQSGEKDIYIFNNPAEKNLITISTPLKINYQSSGVCGITLNINEALTSFRKEFPYINFRFFILTDENNLIGEAGSDYFKDDFIQSFEEKKIDYNINKKITFDFKSDKDILVVSVKQIIFKSGDSKWTTAVAAPYNQFKSTSIFKMYYTEMLIMLYILTIIILWLFFNKIQKRLKETESVLKAVAYGDLKNIKELPENGNDEISEINIALNALNNNLDRTAAFIEDIHKGNIHFDYKPVSKYDKIGNLSLELAKSIDKSKQEEEKRKKEDEIQNWITKGTAIFAEIIRDYSDNLEELSYAIISKLVNYTDADQGGIFVINETEDNEKYIELLASYAYDRRKMLKKRIPWGAGLVGRCILEQESIFMTKIPEDYLNITSGLGKDKPQTLLLVPLIFHEEVYGVAELASFKFLDEYKIRLIEQVSESIASAISMVKINARTAELLKETKIKSEQAASQEEEIRQNIEEMQAVSDGLNQKLTETKNIFEIVKSSIYFAEFDLQGRITDISEPYLKILKKEKKDIIGKVQGSFSAEAQNPESFKKFWDDLQNDNIKEFKQIIQVEDKILKISSTYYPIKDIDGNIIKVISIANIE